MRYRLVVRLTPADVGKRVVIRWRPGPGDSEQMADVLGMFEQADARPAPIIGSRAPASRTPCGRRQRRQILSRRVRVNRSSSK
jgi:hypothetical protein